jgi:hypothetical protein
MDHIGHMGRMGRMGPIGPMSLMSPIQNSQLLSQIGAFHERAYSTGKSGISTNSTP